MTGLRFPSRLVLGTRNRSKLREERQALRGAELELLDLETWPDLESPHEKGESFLENAMLKARYYQQATGLPALGEDSGLEVDALGGAPGIHSSRWLGEDTPYEVKNERLLEKLAGLPPEERSARYVCALALASQGEIVFSTIGTCEGRIAESPGGRGGFGYDPIFYYPPLRKTLAELSSEEKKRVSHRGKAMARLRDYLDRLREAAV